MKKKGESKGDERERAREGERECIHEVGMCSPTNMLSVFLHSINSVLMRLELHFSPSRWSTIRVPLNVNTKNHQRREEISYVSLFSRVRQASQTNYMTTRSSWREREREKYT